MVVDSSSVRRSPLHPASVIGNTDRLSRGTCGEDLAGMNVHMLPMTAIITTPVANAGVIRIVRIAESGLNSPLKSRSRMLRAVSGCLRNRCSSSPKR